MCRNCPAPGSEALPYGQFVIAVHFGAFVSKERVKTLAFTCNELVWSGSTRKRCGFFLRPGVRRFMKFSTLLTEAHMRNFSRHYAARQDDEERRVMLD
mmetsp:Transcript_6291/g.39158  ORF Transcript_6291/g.39158 Transcript_6291/m.39158 type:complete len:98 (-) Transcript_6291:280-573(-)